MVLDVGTDNEGLRADELYMGINEPRMCNNEYYEVGGDDLPLTPCH